MEERSSFYERKFVIELYYGMRKFIKTLWLKIIKLEVNIVKLKKKQ